MFWRIVLCTGTQAVTLQPNSASQRFVLDPVKTAFVRIVVTSVYKRANNGAAEISFEPIGEGHPASASALTCCAPRIFPRESKRRAGSD